MNTFQDDQVNLQESSPNTFEDYFHHYPETAAPFLHQLFRDWKTTQPLRDVTVLHHVPLVGNTLLKIACLAAAGAQVVVSNPSFMSASVNAIQVLKHEQIDFVAELSQLKGSRFDVFFDCGAELYQILGAPRLGAIELTASGEKYYQQQTLSFPVVSIDRSLTKQLETIFGCAESAPLAIARLTATRAEGSRWLIFGFGKIGRGLAYYCVQHQIPFSVVEIEPAAINAAQTLRIDVIHANDHRALENNLVTTTVVIMATGVENTLSPYPKKWFLGKTLANMGILDEFGSTYHPQEVLNTKRPINFILEDPTPIQYIDPELYAHNIAALEILHQPLPHRVNPLASATDNDILHRWCQYHNVRWRIISKWFQNVWSEYPDSKPIAMIKKG